MTVAIPFLQSSLSPFPLVNPSSQACWFAGLADLAEILSVQALHTESCLSIASWVCRQSRFQFMCKFWSWLRDFTFPDV